MTPAYLKAYKDARLQDLAEKLMARLGSCDICPRLCRVDRLKDQKGFCKTGFRAQVCSYLAHHGEEPPISGEKGSGTIFFARCNMACAYCQNYEFSQSGNGSREVTTEELSDFMLQLQAGGCHNINFVTPTHVLPQIITALCAAVPKGLNIPLVYNTSGYELPEVIGLLDGVIDIYLPDMRYADNEQAIKYSGAPDYPKYNMASVKEMHRQVGVAHINSSGLIEKGLIVRHLVMPDNIAGTEKIMDLISKELPDETYISLMSQYFPCFNAGKFPELLRRITLEEYEQAQRSMQAHGLYNGWVQDEHGLDRFAGINIKPNI